MIEIGILKAGYGLDHNGFIVSDVITKMHFLRNSVFVYMERIEKESIIRTLLNWIDEPPIDRKAVYELFKIEGEWAGANFTNEANIPYKAKGGFS